MTPRLSHWFSIFDLCFFKLMMCHYPALGSASDWLRQISLDARPIRSTTQIPVLGSASVWLQHDMGMEFSCSFVRCHFSRKPVVSSWNVSCFLKLAAPWVLQRMYVATPPLPGSHLTCFHQGIAPFPKQSGFPSLLVWCLCHILGSKVFDLMTSFVLMLSKTKE